MDFAKSYIIPFLLAALSVLSYWFFAYGLERSDFSKLIALYSALFLLAYILIERYRLNFWSLAFLGIAFRFVFIGAIPNLSQDFYRFIWDGRVLAQGLSPYLFTPDHAASSGITIAQADELKQGMGPLSASHFSNYPPVNQLFFAIAALLGGKSIFAPLVVLRAMVILADIGILYFGKKILERLNLPLQNIFWYFLNPFIIIELTGNLHFEGVMLFFLIWGLFLLFKGNWLWAAMLIGISVSVKLLPLLFLPLFFQYFVYNFKAPRIFQTFGIMDKRLPVFYVVIILTTSITFLPFLSSEFIENFLATITLWFQNFEFNASVYYLIRWIGYKAVGWNIIGLAGKILPVVVLLFVVALAFFRKNRGPQQLVSAMLLAVSFYFLLSTTVHPWYIATPLLLSVFTKFRFPIVWSFVVMLSYSAYGKNGFNENLWLVALEYVVAIGFMIWEVNKMDPQKNNRTKGNSLGFGTSISSQREKNFLNF